MTLRETYARDICQNPGVPLEDCPRRDGHYALVDERLAGLTDEIAVALGTIEWSWLETINIEDRSVTAELDTHKLAAAIVAALEERT